MRTSTQSRSGDSRARRDFQTRAIEYTVAALAVSALILSALGSGTTTPTSIQTESVQLKSGDTLWELAARHPIAGLDTARTAEYIATVNHLAGAPLHEGADILVPSSSVVPDSFAMR